MPTYDYECEKCELVFEHFQSMNDEPLKTCIHPEGCRNKRARPKVRRLIGTGAGIIFKGSGFYETDYRSKEYTESAKKDSEKTTSKEKSSDSKSTSEKSTSTKSESKKKVESKSKS